MASRTSKSAICFPGFDGKVNHCLNGCGGQGELRMSHGRYEGCRPFVITGGGGLSQSPIVFMMPVEDAATLPCEALRQGATPTELLAL